MSPAGSRFGVMSVTSRARERSEELLNGGGGESDEVGVVVEVNLAEEVDPSGPMPVCLGVRTGLHPFG